MQDGKKKRLSMLDHLVVSGTTAPAPSMMSNNRALRSARDAFDSHRVWDLEPDQIDDTRFKDRLNPEDVLDLRASIEANGQTVPILVRRHATEADRYLLVYGRRRLEAIRGSDKVVRVRALIASMDEASALRAQVAENTARRDLSYIERALFAKELLENGFGNQSQIAEVLNSTKSAISMALKVAEGIGSDLAQAIGPAHAIGRPRWEALIELMQTSQITEDALIDVARAAHSAASEAEDPSSEAFHAVMKAASRAAPRKAPAESAPKPSKLMLGEVSGKIRRTPKGLRVELEGQDEAFLQWFEETAPSMLSEMHARWKARG